MALCYSLLIQKSGATGVLTSSSRGDQLASYSQRLPKSHFLFMKTKRAPYRSFEEVYRLLWKRTKITYLTSHH